MNVGAASYYSGLPTSIQRLRSSTLSLGQGPSHGMDPALRASKMGPEWTDTSSNDHRSKTTRIESRSDSRNSGLMSAVKVGAESLMSLPFSHSMIVQRVFARGCVVEDCWLDALTDAVRGARAGASGRNTLPVAGRRSGRCHREADLGPQPCPHLGDCCRDLRNMSDAKVEVVLPLGQRAELEIDAGGAGPLGELVGIVDQNLVLAVVDHRWRQPCRVRLRQVDPRIG